MTNIRMVMPGGAADAQSPPQIATGTGRRSNVRRRYCGIVMAPLRDKASMKSSPAGSATSKYRFPYCSYNAAPGSSWWSDAKSKYAIATMVVVIATQTSTTDSSMRIIPYQTSPGGMSTPSTRRPSAASRLKRRHSCSSVLLLLLTRFTRCVDSGGMPVATQARQPASSRFNYPPRGQAAQAGGPRLLRRQPDYECFYLGNAKYGDPNDSTKRPERVAKSIESRHSVGTPTYM